MLVCLFSGAGGPDIYFALFGLWTISYKVNYLCTLWLICYNEQKKRERDEKENEINIKIDTKHKGDAICHLFSGQILYKADLIRQRQFKVVQTRDEVLK